MELRRPVSLAKGATVMIAALYIAAYVAVCWAVARAVGRCIDEMGAGDDE
ncbi:hypothetical protein METUNv1_01721 [Methyloversatilis universalis FAM5]|uniref:Uncharacterized protein n=1 Tax=Methyloversatilis universalis (strain ATCC BAA-1314 / DSM 25237 / JCM 13912 / CCUG 52030 / FAM5) TaxID=1000565 RepID=F5RBS6_METUF|nr:hypothetical protein METUNv1_01721 [Methyloversatilis universalis FAM5]